MVQRVLGNGAYYIRGARAVEGPIHGNRLRVVDKRIFDGSHPWTREMQLAFRRAGFGELVQSGAYAAGEYF